MKTTEYKYYILFFTSIILFTTSSLFGADPVVPVDDTIPFTVTSSNTKKTFNPRGNDSPTNSKINSFTQPSKGSVARVNNNTKFKYTPDYNSVPYTTTFTYKIEKNGIVSPTSATVTMNVEGNEAPIAVNDAVSMARPDVSYIQFSPLGNDTPLDSGLKIKTVNTPEHGKTEIKSSSTKIKYTPETDYVGTDSFTYTVKDKLGRISAAATVTVTINGPEMPVAVNQTVSMTKPGPSSISIYPLDDCTPKDTGLKIKTVSKGEHTDTLILNNSKNKITYTPDTDYVGTDSFTYTVKDKLGRISAAGTVTVNIIGPTPPIAFEETEYLIGNARNVDVSVLENDTIAGTNTVEVVTQPTNGTTSLRDNKTVIRYRTVDGFTSGTDTFTYKVLDAYNQPSNIVTVTIIVSSEPVAISDYVQVSSTLTKKIINVLSNDKPSSATIESFTQPGHGSTKFNWDDTKIKYIPESNYTGEDQFTYKIQIGRRQNIRVSEPATVYIYVGDLPDLTATSDTASVNSGSSVTISALENDTGIRSSIKHVATPSEGTASISGDSIIYTAPQDYTGTVTFSYTIQSPFYNSDATGDITVTVSSGGGGGIAGFANTANDILFTKMATQVSSAITWDILANDTGENLSIVSITPASHGTAAISNNKIVYTPDVNYVGNDSFTYTNNNGDVTPAIVVIKSEYDYKSVLYTILGKALTLISEDITVANRKLQNKMPTIEIVLYSNLIYGFYPTTNDVNLENISGEGLEDEGLKYLAELRGKLELADDEDENISEWISEFNDTKAILSGELTAAKDTYNPN